MSTVKNLRKGAAQLLIIANNCPAIRQTEIEYYALLAKVPIHHFEGNNIELGTAARIFTAC